MFKLLLRSIRKKEALLILMGMIFIVLSIWLELLVPSFMSKITTILVDQTIYAGQEKVNEILTQGLLMLCAALGCSACLVVANFCISYMGAGVAKLLRAEMFAKVHEFSPNDFNKFSIPSLITRTTNDITHVQNFVSRGLIVCVKAPIMAVWAISIIVNKSWQWTLATGIGVAILIVMLMLILLFAIPKFNVIQKQTDKLNQCARENLTGVRVVHAFNAERFEEKKFERANKALTRTNLYVNRVMNMIGPVMSLIMNGLTLSVYIIGAFIINNASGMDKTVLFSDMLVFSSYAIQVIMSFMMMSIIFIMLPRATVSAKRMLEVLDAKPSIMDGKLDARRIKQRGTIEFKNVSFKYPGAEDYLLENISFVAHEGDTVALIGPTGSGKSTVVNLITRFYDATDGEILIDGENIKRYKLKDLYNRVGYVPQKSYLFSDTVANNINFGECNYERTELDAGEAVRLAEASEFVDSMKNGINSNIAQAGHNISGGQKQRLSIARALSRRPEILILDDCFSALDFKTDKALRANLAESTSGVTKIMVAQRIGTIQDADLILVLDEGKIVGRGTHDELVNSCDLYKEIYESQVQKEA